MDEWGGKENYGGSREKFVMPLRPRRVGSTVEGLFSTTLGAVERFNSRLLRPLAGGYVQIGADREII